MGEVTHSRLKDGGMRHRYVLYIILLFCNPALCTLYYDRQAYIVIPLAHFQSFYIVCRSRRTCDLEHIIIILCAQIILYSRGLPFLREQPSRAGSIYYDERTAANYIIG